MSKNKLEFAKFVIDSFFDTRSVNFYSYSISKNSNYFKSEFNGAAIEVALNAQLLQQQGQVIVDLNAEDITLSSAKAVLPQQISALDGQVSFASKINIDIAKELSDETVGRPFIGRARVSEL